MAFGETFPPNPRFFRGRRLEQNCDLGRLFRGTRDGRTFSSGRAKMRRSAGVFYATSFCLEKAAQIANSVT